MNTLKKLGEKFTPTPLGTVGAPFGEYQNPHVYCVFPVGDRGDPVWGVYYFMYPNRVPTSEKLKSAVLCREREGGRGV